MGDKHRSEIQKPVKNTLLSGASHGFPFETFQSSSLLIPVSQDSPSVLNDSVGDANKLSSKDLTQSPLISDATEVANEREERTPVSQDSTKQEDQKTLFQTVGQGYTGIFSSFFGGGSQKKQDLNADSIQPSSSGAPSTTCSSPFTPISSVQSFSPALQVPPAASEQFQNDTSGKVIGFSHSLDSPFSQIPSQSQHQNYDAVDTLGKSTSSETKESTDLEQKEIQHFFSNNKSSDFNLGFSNPSPSANIGFESFYGDAGDVGVKNPVLSKAQSAVELPLSGAITSPSGVAPLFFNSPQQNTSVQFYQDRSGSVDSFKPIQSPPLGGHPPLPSGLLSSSAAPPMSTAFTTRNYRRDHHKRLAYAPVPGLTSNTAVSSSYLQPCDNFVSTTSLSSPVISPTPGPLKQPLSTSLSQPSLRLPENISEMNSSNTHQPKLQNSVSTFFNSQPLSSSQSTPQNFLQSFEKVPTPTLISQAPHLQGNNNTSDFSSLSPCDNQSGQLPAVPSTSSSVEMVSSIAVHPPIMSTREQPVAPPPSSERAPSPMIIPPSLNNLANMGTSGIIYRPVYHHWFLRTEIKDSKEIWQPFSMTDSLALEQAYNSETLTPATVVPTDGGRYDVNITDRIRSSVYWEEEPKPVRRCSWFYKSSTESRYHPYDENTAEYLEEEYKTAVTTNTWNKKVDLPTGEYIIMYGPNSMGLFQSIPQTPEGWEAEPDYSQNTSLRSKLIKRGVLDDFEIEDGESPCVDHLIFVLHGIGSFCDLKFRTIEAAGDWNSISTQSLFEYVKSPKVDVFRNTALQLIKSHFRDSVDQGVVNRVEVLPVSWHKQLHGETTGVDRKLQTITLKSIPKLRHFTNDTLLDILFYTSPVYCQNIMQQVGREVNTLFAKFKTRNPDFKGGVSLVGHSLGSLIFFDMLCHQKPMSPRMENISEETKTNLSEVEHEVTTIISPDKKKRSLSRNVSYVIGTAGTGQPFIEYPQLAFQPVAFFALGSPIGMFVTVRGIDSLGIDFCLPTCSRFFNVFHPFDPVAYRIEALINPELAEKRPVLVPHHKGRKRMHLEFKEKMAKVGADLKQRLVDSVRSTWNTVYQFSMFGRADDDLEQEVDRVIEKQLERQRVESINECDESDFNAGHLNLGRRIDYVLQEAPIESFNEYVFAIRSHVIYWGSEDTILLILKEVYSTMGISPDNERVSVTGTQNDVSVSSPSSKDSENFPSTSKSYNQPFSYGFK